MKAVQVTQPGGPEVLTLVDLPVPMPKPNEAVVQIKAAGVNFILKLTQKGSLFITRPSLTHYIASREELEQRSNEVMQMIIAGELKLRIHDTYPLARAQDAHRDLEGRKTIGKLLLIP